MATVSSSYAQTVVNWDGSNNDLVSATEDIAQVATFTTGSGFQSPTVGTDYYDPAVGTHASESPDFYSAVSNASLSGADGLSIFTNAGPLDRIRLRVSAASTDINAMFVWEMDDSLTLGSVSMQDFTSFSGTISNAGYHFIFQNSDDDWYISATKFTDANLTVGDVSAESWLAYTPHTAGVATIGASATVSNFNTQLVGVFLDYDATGGAGVNFSGFRAVAIPELGTYALFAGLAGVLLVTARRRRA